MNRRLYRCRHDQRISGVASGVAEFFGLDPSLVRILWILSVFLGGVGLLLYIAMAIIVPLEPEEGYAAPSVPTPGSTGEAASWHPTPPTNHHRPLPRVRWWLVGGVVCQLAASPVEPGVGTLGAA